MPVVVITLSPKRIAAAGVTPPADWEVRYLETPDVDQMIAACRGADAIITLASLRTLDAGIIEQFAGLKLIQCFGVGYNHVDLAAARRMGIPVANAPGENAAAVAEFTIGVIIALQRRFVEADAAIKAGRYTPFRKQSLEIGLREIAGSRLGLVGLGNIGRRVAVIAGLLGASVGYYATRRQPAAVECELGITYRPLPELLATSDIVSLHVPLDESTRGLIGARELALMPTGSLLVNTARGEVTDQAALAAALESGHLGGAAIDTFSPEPPPADHPLFTLSPAAAARLLATPHSAGVTTGANRRMLAAAVANIERVLRGEAPHNVVNGVK